MSAGELFSWNYPSGYEAHSIERLSEQSPSATLFEYGLGDRDGDGRRELVFSIPTGFQVLKSKQLSGGRHAVGVFEEIKIPSHFHHPYILARIGCVEDLNGDGRAEILATVASEDRSEWRLLINDPTRKGFSLDVNLPLGPDRNGDKIWDGGFFVAGVMPGACPDGHIGLLLGVMARHDWEPRGVILIDPRDGNEVWRYTIGPNPSLLQFWIGDLDGDADSELVFATNSPANLGGKLVNGSSDNESRIFAIDHEGSLIWSRVTGAHFYSTHIAVGDLDGDGLPEVVSITQNHNTDPGRLNRLSIWSGKSGDLLAEEMRESDYFGLVLQAIDGTRPGSFMVGSRKGSLRRFEMRDRELVQVAGVDYDGPVSIICAGDLLPAGGTEYVVAQREKGILIVDEKLRTLATLPSEEPINGKEAGFIWRASAEESFLLLRTAEGRRGLSFAPLGKTWMPGLLRGLLLFVPLAALVAYALSRGRIRSRRETVHPRKAERGADRKHLHRILRELEETNHGTISATRGLRRLVWLLEANHRGKEMAAPMRERLASSLADYLETVHPRLEQILNLATGANYHTELIREVTAQLSRTRELLDEIRSEEFARSTLDERMLEVQQSAERVELGFRQLQTALQSHFSVDSVPIVKRLASMFEEKTEDEGIDLELCASDLPEGGRCVIDAGDLRFVLENLMANAIRSMSGPDGGSLTVSILRAEQCLEIRVKDSGCGIAPADRESIFRPGVSSRDGGGLGLHRSREIIGEWNGSLELVLSEVGSGSEFLLRLPAPKGNTFGAGDRFGSGDKGYPDV